MKLTAMLIRLSAGVLPVFACSLVRADEIAEEGFVPLFNGRDLSGWHNVNGAPDTWSVREGLIICKGKPICVLRSDRQYQNFVLELEWVHIYPKGNSGCFVWSDPVTAKGQPFTRAIECQILDGTEGANYTSHGDVFAIHGARMTPDRPHPAGWERCLPSERRSKPAGEWNHYRITCIDGAVKLAVNGKEVSGGSGVNPRKGYICLESEGSEVHFRNVKIKELPPSKEPLKPEQIAAVDEGFKSLYTGADLSGWRVATGDEAHWEAKGWPLDFDGKGGPIRSEREVGDAVVIADWRWTGKESPAFPIDVRGALAATKAGANVKTGEWNRCQITLKQGKATVVLNEKTLVDGAALPSLPERGPIVLGVNPGGAIQFANVYVRELR